MALLCILDSNETTREENALSELVEVAITQRILLATIERRWSDSSISSASSPLSSLLAPFSCDVAVHGLGRPNLRNQRNADDIWQNQEVHLLFEAFTVLFPKKR